MKFEIKEREANRFDLYAEKTLIGERLTMATIIEELSRMTKCPLTANEYQKEALRTANTEQNNNLNLLVNCALGLTGEAGEYADLIKKFVFHNHDFEREHLKKELGDICWYVAVASYALGFSFEEILKTNIDKLKARYPDGFDCEKSKHRKAGDI